MPIITNLEKDFKKKKTIPASKKVGIVLLVIATIGYLGLFIKWIPFLHDFLIGTFGLFSYALFLIMYIIGGALFKGAKYVYSKRYIVYLCMALISILSIFHVAFSFSWTLDSYGSYLANLYTRTNGESVGGLILGLIVYPFQKYMFSIGAIFFFLIMLAISIWLIYDYLTRVRYIKKSDTKVFNKKLEKMKAEKITNISFETKDDVKIGLDAEIEKEQQLREQSAKQTGLDKTIRNERFVDKKELNTFASDFLNNKDYSFENPQPKKPKLERPTDYTGTFGYNLVNNSPSKSTKKSSNYDKNMEFLEATLKGSSYIAPTKVNKNVDTLKVIDSQKVVMPKQSNLSMQDFLDANFSGSKQAESSFQQKQSQNSFNSTIKQDNLYSNNYNTVSTEPSQNAQNDSISSNQNSQSNAENNIFTEKTESTLQENPVASNLEQTQSKDLSDNSSNTNLTNSKNQTDYNVDLNKEIEQSVGNMKTNTVSEDIDLKNFKLPKSLEISSSSRRGLRRNENQTDLFGAKQPSKQEDDKSKPHIFKKYVYPKIDLLNNVAGDTSSYNQDCEANAKAIENTLENFNIPAKVTNMTVGPAVTRYELDMPAGISVNMVSKYTNDITAAVAASKSVRIQAPIPGKSAVGVEVPNKKVAMVGIREVLESKEFLVNKNALSYAVGKQVDGKCVVADMHDMPHMLVAGSTGSGKSVALNTLIVSMIYKYGPEDLRFILVDPKQVEFYLYNGIPHLLLPEAIIDPAKSLNALDWAINEMERRYALLRESGVREIMEYNELPEVKNHSKEKLAHIVIIIDEVGDIMSLSNIKKDFEEKVRRLTQKARAIGINLILATQRPSVDVITGVIKANLPSRMAFAVQNYQDSKTILDTGGADKLLGKGDMLFSPRGIEPFRVQGCFISTQEIQNVVNFVKQNNESYYDEDIAKAINKQDEPNDFGGDGNSHDDGGFDPLMPDCLKLVIKTGCASASMLQRRFSIGNPKASRIIDQMEMANFIGPSNGSKPRTVYITAEEFKERFGQSIDD